MPYPLIMKIVKTDGAYQLKKEFAIRAFNGGCMIYADGRWYTPREFMDSDFVLEQKQVGMQKYYNATLHHAQAAIERMQADLNKAHEEYQDFMKRVLTAFEMHSREARKNKA